MALFVMNPGTKKRRRRGRKGARAKKVCNTFCRRAKKGWRKRRAKKGGLTLRSSCKTSLTRARRGMRKTYKTRVSKLIAALRTCRGGKSSPAVAGPHVYRTIGDNPRRRRSRSRNPRFGYRRKKARNYSTWLPAFSNGSMAAGLTKGFSPSTLAGTLPVISGFVGNQYLSAFLSGLKFLPAFMRTGVGSYVLGIGSAGLLAAGTKMVKPGLAPAVLLGGVSQVLVKVMMRGIGMVFGPVSTLKGLGDYFSTKSMQNIHPLLHGMGDLEDGLGDYDDGLGDYFTTSSPVFTMQGQPTGIHGMDTDAAELSGMGDFLTVGDSQRLQTIDEYGVDQGYALPPPPMHPAIKPEAVAGGELATQK